MDQNCVTVASGIISALTVGMLQSWADPLLPRRSSTRLLTVAMDTSVSHVQRRDLPRAGWRILGATRCDWKPFAKGSAINAASRVQIRKARLWAEPRSGESLFVPAGFEIQRLHHAEDITTLRA